MPENIYPQLPTAPSFNIEMVRKYHEDIANLKEKYTEKQRKYKNAYNRLLHASTGASTVALASGVSTIGTSVTIVGIPIMQVSISSKTIPPGTNPRDTTRREQKPSPRDNNCVQKPFPRDKTGSQKPHPRDIKLENSDTISNEKLCRLNK